jgi:hypothetical protein
MELNKILATLGRSGSLKSLQESSSGAGMNQVEQLALLNFATKASCGILKVSVIGTERETAG